jgi:putative membrane protein insertion efficiency factor
VTHAVSSFARRLATLPIRLYRRFLSPLKPPMCRFAPTCSAYAVEAIETHGLARGLALAVWRILRCNPLCKGGFDPVPPRGRWRGGKRDREDAVESRPPAGEDPRP